MTKREPVIVVFLICVLLVLCAYGLGYAIPMLVKSIAEALK